MSNRQGNRPANIVHEDQVAWQEDSHGKFAYRRRKLAQASGGADLGCSLYEIPGGDPKRRTLHAYLSATPTRPYYDGED